MFTKLTTAVMICLITACSSPTTQKQLSNPKHLHGEWYLVSVYPDTTDLKKGMIDKWPSITIDTAKKMIGGYSGCNSFGGQFTLSNDTLAIGELMANQRGCLGSVEPALFKHLKSVNRYAATQDSLKLFAQDTVLLSFARKVAQAK
jgi:heat shock protein HslJ